VAGARASSQHWWKEGVLEVVAARAADEHALLVEHAIAARFELAVGARASAMCLRDLMSAADRG